MVFPHLSASRGVFVSMLASLTTNRNSSGDSGIDLGAGSERLDLDTLSSWCGRIFELCLHYMTN